MFSDNSKEQELYHSIAAVGTLLLEIGEVGKRFYLSKTSISESNQGETTLSSSIDSTSDVDSIAQSLDKSSISKSPSNYSPDGEQAKTETETSSDSNTEKVTESEESKTQDRNSEGNTTDQAESGTSLKADSGYESQQSIGESSQYSKPDSDWSITFEQFLASILTEQPLVDYFEKQIDVTESVSKMRNRRLLTRQTSYALPDKH